jgi:hypothetical protein
VSQKYAGEQAALTVWRDGQELQMDVQLSRPQPLVPLHLDGGNPSYLIVAGMLFFFLFFSFFFPFFSFFSLFFTVLFSIYLLYAIFIIAFF